MDTATEQQDQATLSRAEDLDDAIEELEEVLAPLLEIPLSETLQQLDHLQNAKLEVSLAYAIHNLLWMYLRCKGVTEKDHPAARELARLKGYFQKIQVAEKPAAQRQLAVDKGAATRFINHALSAAQKLQEDERRTSNGKEPYKAQDVVNPGVMTDVGKTTMLKWLPREAKKLEGGQDEGDDEDSELELVDGKQEREEEQEKAEEDLPTAPASPSPEKGEGSKAKGKRPRQDPFAGYDNKATSSGQPSKKKRKKQQK